MTVHAVIMSLSLTSEFCSYLCILLPQLPSVFVSPTFFLGVTPDFAVKGKVKFPLVSIVARANCVMPGCSAHLCFDGLMPTVGLHLALWTVDLVRREEIVMAKNNFEC